MLGAHRPIGIGTHIKRTEPLAIRRIAYKNKHTAWSINSAHKTNELLTDEQSVAHANDTKQGDRVNKYKATFLPTGRSRKTRSLFFYASNDKVAIAKVGERVGWQYPDGVVISLQGPDRGFIDLEGE